MTSLDYVDLKTNGYLDTQYTGTQDATMVLLARPTKTCNPQ